jgi:hypothetical protein
MVAALAAALALAAGLAAAQPLPVPLPDGTRVGIAADATGGRHVVERRSPDGRLVEAFGEQGRVPLSREDEPPAALRVDARGRIWVAGSTDGGARAVVVRLNAQGRPDPGFGANGRSVLAPGGRDARAADLLPQDDGSAWVQGVVVDARGDEVAGVWRLRPDGGIDSRFGAGGVWLDPGQGRTDAAGLQQSPDGELALGLRRAEVGGGTLETWTWRAGTEPRRTQATPVDVLRLGAWQLAWRDGVWRWVDAAPPPLPAAAGPAPLAAAEPAREAAATAIATPFSGADARAETASSVADPSWGWWLLLPAALAALWWWRRSPRED